MSSDPNPYAVSPNWEEIQDAAMPAREVPGTWVETLLLILILATCLIGSAISTVTIESIIPSGIILTLLGAALIAREVTARRRRTNWPIGLMFGLAGPLFSVFITALIALNDWGPSDARSGGVPTLCMVFAVAMCVFGILAYRELRTVQAIVRDSNYSSEDREQDEAFATDS